VYNYSTAVGIRTSPLAAELLHYFDSPRTTAEVQAEFQEYPADHVGRAVSLLKRRGLIEPEAPTGQAERLDGWDSWNPAAGFFHFSTKDVPFVEDEAVGAGPAKRPARAVKRIAGVPRVDLPPPEASGQWPRVLLSRRTWRQFSREPVPIESLATLLGLTFRIQKTVSLPGIGPLRLRTSPSPGARQALEAYVLALRVEGLARGLYHYAADRHQLERLAPRATRRRLLGYLPTQSWYGEAAALVLITAVFPRVWGRYDYPRAYRAVLLEAGHFCQTFLLTATWLGLAPFCSMALADSRIEQDLGIDGVTESVLYAAGVGVRPPGVDWAPTPAPKRGRMSR
jgi:SagB-type dehydrogenase family enzyme